MGSTVSTQLKTQCNIQSSNDILSVNKVTQGFYPTDKNITYFLNRVYIKTTELRNEHNKNNSHFVIVLPMLQCADSLRSSP
jgi:hypothetical protein